jgi:hypothetical protein
VLEEAAIFGDQHGVHEVAGDLLEGNRDAMLTVERRDGPILRVEEDRGPRARIQREPVADRVDVPVNLPDGIKRGSGAHQHEHEDDTERVAE